VVTEREKRQQKDPTLASSEEDIEDAYNRIIGDDEQVILNETYLEMMPTSRNFTVFDRIFNLELYMDVFNIDPSALCHGGIVTSLEVGTRDEEELEID
jgi:hypothetical protein